MEVNKLEPGQIYTYRELCNFLKEPFMKGGSKESQLKKWRCFFKFKIRKNYSIIIEEIYENPKPFIVGRSKGNNRNPNKKIKYKEEQLRFDI